MSEEEKMRAGKAKLGRKKPVKNLRFRPAFSYTLQTPGGEKTITAGWIHQEIKEKQG